jgi:hypothetical protein
MKALSPALLSIVPNVFLYTTPESVTYYNYPDNKLTDNLYFHPSIIAKDFLLNIGNLITVYILIGISYPLFLFLSFKLPVFSRYLGKYKWNVVLRAGMMTFFQLFLAAAVHLKYVRIALYRIDHLWSPPLLHGLLGPLSYHYRTSSYSIINARSAWPTS